VNKIPRCFWLPERARWSYLARSDCLRRPQEQFTRKPYRKSFVDQTCWVKMAGYWPRSSHLDLTVITYTYTNNPYILPTYAAPQPDSLETHLLYTTKEWACSSFAIRIIFSTLNLVSLWIIISLLFIS